MGAQGGGNIGEEGKQAIDRERASDDTYLSGAGQRELNRNPSLACTIANSRVIASTAPLLAVYAN